MMDRAGDSGGSENPALANSLINLLRKEKKTFTDGKTNELELSNLSEAEFMGRKSAYAAGLEIKTERDYGASKVKKS